jgi:Putative metallopeptidase
MRWFSVVTIAALFVLAPAFGSRAAAGTPAPSGEIQRKVAEAARVLASRPRLKGKSQAERERHVEFVVGNLLFVLGHEAGHALIRELDVPVTGREEDAADIFSVLMALMCEEGFGERVLANAALGWFLSDRSDRRERRSRRDDTADAKYYDEHGIDLQRAYNIVCLMVGSNPEKFAGLADAAKLPRERQTGCRTDYLSAQRSWHQVLQPHLRKPDQPKTPINVVYGPGNGKYDAHAEVAQQMKLLETIAETLSDRFAWPESITLEMRTCGDPNARFELQTRKVLICYELADEFSDLYYRYGRLFSLDAKASPEAVAGAPIAPSAASPAVSRKAHNRKTFRNRHTGR